MSTETSCHPLTVATAHGRAVLRRLAWSLALFDLLYPWGVFAYARWSAQPYWHFFTAEGNFTAWWSSVQLLLVAALGYGIYRLRQVSVHAGVLSPASHGWVWLVAAAGFLLFAIDERFNFHEWLRDAVFRPLDLFAGSRYVIDGDVGLYLFLLLGLAATPLLRRDLRLCPPAWPVFAAALGLTTAVVIIDSLRSGVMQNWPHWRFWDYPFEEVGEVWAQCLFLWAFVLVLDHWLRLWGSVPEPSSTEPADD